MGIVIGIDLGTTNSCVAFVDDKEPVVIPNAEGSRTTPSYVSVAKTGERRVGVLSKRQAASNAERTVYAVKRLMGQRFDSPDVKRQAELVPYAIVEAENGDAWVRVEDRSYSPPEISAMILGALKETAEAYLSRPVSEAVITVPAYFDDAQRQATKDAGRIAGLEVKRIINEPTAAALAYGLDKKQGERIVVYDLGGGTFDVSILEIASGVFNVKATAGDTHLGGEDFDNVLVQHIVDSFQKSTGIDLRKDRGAMQRVKEQTENAKHELSTSLSTEINLPFIAADSTGPKHLQMPLKRSELEKMVSELIDRTLDPCRQALKDAGLGVQQIDAVILVGGQTRMPLVQRRVTEFFGKAPHKGVNPDEVVAFGAALQGASLAGEVDEVLLLDVTPLSLGVETGGGVFHKLIERNTTVPTEQSEIFTTSMDSQPFVPIHILQGEREMAADNRSLARFELAPIPPAPRGVPQIEVTFSIDANGITDVRAKDLGTGKEQSIRVVASSGLSSDQVDKLVEEAKQHQQSDEKRREMAELTNNAEALLYTSERAVQECAELVASEVLEEVQTDINSLRLLLENDADAIAIRDALQRLELSAYRIAESMYGGETATE